MLMLILSMKPTAVKSRWQTSRSIMSFLSSLRAYDMTTLLRSRLFLVFSRVKGSRARIPLVLRALALQIISCRAAIVLLHPAPALLLCSFIPCVVLSSAIGDLGPSCTGLEARAESLALWVYLGSAPSRFIAPRRHCRSAEDL